MKTSLNWGIVSTGRISSQFTDDLTYVANGEAFGVAARQVKDAINFAEQHQIPHVFSSYQALFDSPDIDAVYIGTPHTHHFEQAKAALNAGKHVLCEKPVTVSVEQAVLLNELAKSKGLFLMEAMWTYFLPAIQQAKAWFEQGKIGAIKHIKADFGYPMAYDPQSRVYNKALAGGCLLDMGIYPLAISNYFLTGTLAFQYINAHLAPNGVDDDVVMIATSDGVNVALTTSFQCKLANQAQIIGEKGMILIPDFWRASQCFLYQGEECIDTFEAPRASIGLNYEAEAAGQAILSGAQESPIMPMTVSIALQRQMEEVRALFS